MNAYAIGIIFSILLYLVIGSYAGRKVKHLDDYFVAGRGAPTLLIVGTLVASFLSTNAFLGETGFTYDGHGAVLIIMTAVNCVGYVVGALFFGRYIRRSEVITVAEFFGRRFNSHRVQVVAGITIIVGISAYLLAVTQGASLIISEVMQLPYWLTLFIVWLGYTSFTLYSGSRGVVITDTIMFALFTIVGFIAMYFIIDATGGWFIAIKTLAGFDLKPGIISWHGVIGPGERWQSAFESVTWGIILGVSWGFVVAVSPWQSSRYLMAKNEHTVIRSACLASVAVILLYLALVSAAAAINLSNPDIQPSEKAMIWAAFNLMPLVPGVLLMAGITAAALSSASTFLSLIAFSASHDLVDLESMQEERQLRISRYTMLAIGLVILLIAFFQPPAIMLITYFAGTLFASSWGPVAFMSIWSEKITADGAFWGIISGFLGNIVTKILTIYEIINLPVYLDPFIIGIVLSFVTIRLVSAMGHVSDRENQYRKGLHVTPTEDYDQVMVNFSAAISKLLIVMGLVVIMLVSVYYVIPYHRALALGQWVISGEFLMTVLYGCSLIFSGMLAYKWINKSYKKG